MRITTEAQAHALRLVVGSRIVHEMRRHLRHNHPVWFIDDENDLAASDLTSHERDFCRAQFAIGKRWAWIFRGPASGRDSNAGH